MSILVHIAQRALNRPLLVHPDKVPLILGVLTGRIPVDAGAIDALRESAQARIDQLPPEARARMLGEQLAPSASRFVGSATDVDPLTGRSKGLPYKRTADGIAIISIVGSLINRGAWVGASSGEVSYEGIKLQLDHAANDSKTRGVVLDIESPGGEAVGAFETADAVRALAAQKPVTAVVSGMAASAAYAIASAASRIITMPTGVSGSIGVVLLHGDFSRQLDKAGITPTLIFAGAHKVDGNPFEPLTEAVHADLQAEVNQFYDLFVETVAKGRNMSPKSVRGTEARTFIGAEAVKQRLADDVGTFETALAEMKTRLSGGVGSLTKRSLTMSNTNDADGMVPKAQHDAALAAARADGVTAGKAEAETAGKAATAAAVKSERERIGAILGSDEAKGREASAQHLALSTEMSADEAKKLLATMAKGSATATIAERANSAGPVGLTVTGADPAPTKPAAKLDTGSIYANRRKAMGQA